jgi:hypothetical protein
VNRDKTLPEIDLATPQDLVPVDRPYAGLGLRCELVGVPASALDPDLHRDWPRGRSKLTIPGAICREPHELAQPADRCLLAEVPDSRLHPLEGPLFLLSASSHQQIDPACLLYHVPSRTQGSLV